MSFKYLDLPYKTSGKLTNYRAPRITCELSSPELELESTLAINRNVVRISMLKGRYLGSDFTVKGAIDTSDAPNLNADLSGELNIDAEDIVRFKPRLKKIDPKGVMDVDFELHGNPGQFKSCDVEAAQRA